MFQRGVHNRNFPMKSLNLSIIFPVECMVPDKRISPFQHESTADTCETIHRGGQPKAHPNIHQILLT